MTDDWQGGGNGEVPDEELDAIRKLLEGSRAEEARQRVEAILRHHSDSLEARCLLAESYSQLGYTTHATAELEAILRFEPSHPLANALLGQLGIPDASTNIELTAVEDDLSFSGDTVIVLPEAAEQSLRALANSADDEMDGPITVPLDGPPQHEANTEDENAIRTRPASQLETIDADLLEILEEPADRFVDRIRPQPPAPFKKTLLKTPKLVRPRVPPAAHPSGTRPQDDDTFGTFRGLSQSDIDGARKVAEDMGMIPSTEPPGIDSYLAQVIGRNTPDAPISAQKDAGSDAETAPVDIPLLELADDNPTPRHVESVRAPKPSEGVPPPTAPAPSAPVQQSSPREVEAEPPRKAGTAVDRPSLRNQPVVSADTGERSGPGVVVDTGFDEEDPTINIDAEDARKQLIEIAQAHEQVEVEERPTEAWAEPPVPPRVNPWTKIALRTVVVAAVAYSVYLVAWFPITWEHRLTVRIDQKISEGTESWNQGTYEGATAAIEFWGEATKLRGSSWDAIESGASWWVEDVLGREHLQVRRDEAQQMAAFGESFIAAKLDPTYADAAEQSASDIETPSLMGRAAKGYALLARGESVAARTAIESFVGLEWPSAALMMLLADLELERGRAEDARRYASAAVAISTHSYFARLMEAEATAALDPEAGLEAYQAIIDDTLGNHAPAELRAAQLRRQLGEDPSAELSDLLNDRAEELSPKQRAEAYLELAQARVRVGRADEAETHARTALALDGTLSQAYAFLIGYFLQQGRVEGAANELRTVDELGLKSPHIESMRAQMYALQGRMNDAFVALEQLTRNGSPHALRLQAALVLEHGQVSQAREDFRRAARQLPSGRERALVEALADLLAPELSIHDRGWLDIKSAMGTLTQEEQLMVAWALLWRGEHVDVSAGIFDTVQGHVPTHPSALAGRCAHATFERQEETMLKRCTEAVALAPDYTPAIQAAATAWTRLERYPDAFQAWQKVISSYPNLDAFRGALNASLITWQLDKADEILNQWLSAYGASPEQYFWAGRVALQRGAIDEAKQYLGRAVDSDKSPKHWRPALASALYESGSFGKARETLVGLETREGARGGAALVESAIALSERQPEEAKRHARNAKQWLEEDNADIRQRSNALIALAQAELATPLPRTDIALKLLQDALKIDRTNVEGHYQEGLLLLKLTRIEDARAAFETALSIYPRHELSKRALTNL